MKKFCLISILTFISTVGYSQIDSIELSVSTVIAAGSEGYLPHYVGFNKFGKLNPMTNDGYFEASFYYPIINKNKWKIETGIDYVVKPVLDESFFHQAFLNVHYGAISLRFGKNEINNDWYNDELGSGNLFQSQNARTLTKIGGGIWKYTPVPFFKYIEVKGAVEVGKFSNDRTIQDALYHEKFAYLKTAKLPINPFIGLNHNVMFAGSRPDGTELPSDFWEAFFAQSAINSGNASDSINAAGAHFGVFDLGFEMPFDKSLLKVSFGQPISDGSGISNNFTSNKDYVLAIEMVFEDHPFLKGIMYENINTTHQSGEGVPDPRVNGRFYTTGELNRIEDRDAFLLNELGIETENISQDEFMRILRLETNFGYKWGGRDDHYNNGQYPFGNTFHGLVIGNPLFTTRERFETATGETLNERLFIVNNRIVAHHVGVAAFYKDIDINLWLTWSYNYGTYAGKYGGNRGSWNLDEEYYFLNVAGLQNMGVEFKKPFGKIDARAIIGVDTGDFGTNVGTFLGVTYNIF